MTLCASLGRHRGLPMSMIGSSYPSMNISETDKEIEITAEMPGLQRRDVESPLEGNVLTIRGEKRSHHLVERSYGVFYRMLELPAGVDPSTVQATMSKGILRITIPKPPNAAAKKIEVKEAA